MPRVARRTAFCLWPMIMSLLLGASASAQPWPAPIRSLQGKGLTIVEQFEAPGGITGFAARAGGRPIALYLTPDGQHVIVGTLLDADGNNLSKPRLDATIEQPDLQKSWPLLEKADWIGDGADDAPRRIYVFTDPNCPYCHKFYERARPWVDAGKVQLRHIPVGILKPTSTGKAAALLAADDPERAMNEHESNYRSGGIEPMDDIPAPLAQQVAANNILMSDLGIQGTPGIVYRDGSDRIHLRQGVPQGAALDAIMGRK